VYVCNWIGLSTTEEHLKSAIIAKGELNDLRWYRDSKLE